MSYSKPFAKSEYDARVDKVRQRTQAAGFDLLICQDSASMGWLTGFDGWSFYTPQAVLLHLIE
jgi:ectoine hydrolase